MYQLQSDQRFLAAVQAEAELKRLGQVYGVYAEHADNVRQYSQQLWADLDITRMVTGTDEVAKKLRALTSLKMLPVYETVEKEIQGFKNSLPLMRDLKNDALRKRHWDQLMAVTGVHHSCAVSCCLVNSCQTAAMPGHRSSIGCS